MKILKAIYYVIVGVLVVVALLLIVSVLPITGNIKFLTVLSGSMEPTIHTGAIVMVKPMSEYNVGDVITFKLSGEKTPVTHRIYEVREKDGQKAYITKGDANNSPDTGEISLSAIEGRVLCDVPYIGYAVDFVRKPVGFMLVIIVPAVIIIYEEAKKIGREIIKLRKKGKDENI